jgi:hypothetical protein
MWYIKTVKHMCIYYETVSRFTTLPAVNFCTCLMWSRAAYIDQTIMYLGLNVIQILSLRRCEISPDGREHHSQQL